MYVMHGPLTVKMAIISSYFGVAAAVVIHSTYDLHALEDKQSRNASKILDCGFSCISRGDCAAFTWEPDQVCRIVMTVAATFFNV